MRAEIWKVIPPIESCTEPDGHTAILQCFDCCKSYTVEPLTGAGILDIAGEAMRKNHRGTQIGGMFAEVKTEDGWRSFRITAADIDRYLAEKGKEK